MIASVSLSSLAGVTESLNQSVLNKAPNVRTSCYFSRLVIHRPKYLFNRKSLIFLVLRPVFQTIGEPLFTCVSSRHVSREALSHE